jgi:YHS domain-containing protein
MPTLSRRQFISSICVLSIDVAPAETFAGGARVALSGYDPVSYFTEGRPEKGLAEFTASFDDATYWFKNAEHRSLFIANPERYAPQFQGFCTIDLSRGVKAEPDPEAWTIVNGKLYVFGAKRGPGVFAQDSAAILGKVDEKWPELSKQH